MSLREKLLEKRKKKEKKKKEKREEKERENQVLKKKKQKTFFILQKGELVIPPITDIQLLKENKICQKKKKIKKVEK